jgi:hypothetical protein
MLMNFDLVKWRLASLKYAAPAAGSYTRAKRRHADAIKWYLIKIYLDSHCKELRETKQSY